MSMTTTQFIEYKFKRYEIKEPTIKMWKEMMRVKDLLEPTDMFVKIIELTTGLTREQIMDADVVEVETAGEKLMSWISQKEKKVVHEFEFNGQQYQFLDVNDLSFGQYIDIDSFLQKDESYREQNLNELAAYLYIEKGTKYGEKPIKKRIKAFDDLPIKYLDGAIFFLLNIAKASEEITQICSQSWVMEKWLKMKIILRLIGDGIRRSLTSPKTKYGKLITYLLSPLLCVSITFRILWIIITKKKKL